MKNLKKVLIGILAFVGLLGLASCNKKIEGELSVVENRLSLEFTASFENGEQFENGNAKAYIALYKGETYAEKKDLTFPSSFVECDVIFSSLVPGTTYTGKLYVTQNGEATLIDELEATTLAAGEDENDPILIESVKDFKDMANDVTAYYKLACDLDFGGESISIFKSSKIFAGSFDGDGHTISNFKLTSNTYMGLFGYIEDATIKNLTVSKVTVDLSSTGRGETYMGALVGKAINSEITNCHVKEVNFKFSGYSTAKVSLGGFAGRLHSTIVDNCSAETTSVEITKARLKMAVGLFIGRTESTTKVTNCYSVGTLSARVYFTSGQTESDPDYVYVGGFIGINDAPVAIENCYTIVDIKVDEDLNKTESSEPSKTHELAVGGFIGGNWQGYVNTKNCLAVADLDVTTKFSKASYVGGFIGSVRAYNTSFKDSAYVAKEKGITLNSKLDGVTASVLYGKINTPAESLVNFVAYSNSITAPEGLTLGNVAISTDLSFLSEDLQNIAKDYPASSDTE